MLLGVLLKIILRKRIVTYCELIVWVIESSCRELFIEHWDKWRRLKWSRVSVTLWEVLAGLYLCRHSQFLGLSDCLTVAAAAIEEVFAELLYYPCHITLLILSYHLWLSCWCLQARLGTILTEIAEFWAWPHLACLLWWRNGFVDSVLVELLCHLQRFEPLLVSTTYTTKVEVSPLLAQT